jgi:hypothetical protein
MSVPQIHKEFFHAVSHLEPMVRLWSEDPHFKDKALAALFHHPIPSYSNGESLAFGAFIDKLNQLANKHGDAVRLPEAPVKDVVINSDDIYVMAQHIVNRTRSHCRDLGQMEQLLPLVKELLVLVDSLIEVKHFEPQQRIDFEKDFVLHAKIFMRRRFDHLELFDEEKAKAMAKTAEAKITPLFESLPGAFQDEMTSFAIILEGGQHGLKQANTLKELAESAGPCL